MEYIVELSKCPISAELCELFPRTDYGSTAFAKLESVFGEKLDEYYSILETYFNKIDLDNNLYFSTSFCAISPKDSLIVHIDNNNDNRIFTFLHPLYGGENMEWFTYDREDNVEVHSMNKSKDFETFPTHSRTNPLAKQKLDVPSVANIVVPHTVTNHSETEWGSFLTIRLKSEFALDMVEKWK